MSLNKIFYPAAVGGGGGNIKINKPCKIGACLCRYRWQAKILEQPQPVLKPLICEQGFVIFSNIPFRVFKVEAGDEVMAEHLSGFAIFGKNNAII